jgi:hypothetical protein
LRSSSIPSPKRTQQATLSPEQPPLPETAKPLSTPRCTVTFATPPPSTSQREPSVAEPVPTASTQTPDNRCSNRLKAFVAPSGANTLVAAEVQGMGRVAMARNILFDRLGSSSAEEAIAAGSQPRRVISFGDVAPANGSPIVKAFERSSSCIDPALQPESPVIDERLVQIRSWLESPESSDEENRESWSTIPKEWDTELDTIAQDVAPVKVEDPTAVEDEDLATLRKEVRVGGKSVRVLWKTRRNQPTEDDVDSQSGAIEDGDISEMDDVFSSGSKRKARDASHCICNYGDERGGAMVQCDACEIWYHLKCLRIPSARQLGSTWSCFRCERMETPALSSPAKRARHEAPATPVTSYREPTFVPSSFSPRPRSNFHYGAAADDVLAPALPGNSPTRRFLPAPAPATPQHGRHEYGPDSPLLHRASRSRMISSTFEDPPVAWTQQWDASTLPHDEHNVMAPLDADFWQCSTPSRTISTTHGAWIGEAGLQTPNTVSRRQRGPSYNCAAAGSSHDFLSSLREEETGQPFAQRLFSSPAQQPAFASHARRASHNHRRHPSYTSALHGSPAHHWATPAATPARATPVPRQSQHQSPYSPSPYHSKAGDNLRQFAHRPSPISTPLASGMVRSNSGLGIGLDESAPLDGSSLLSSRLRSNVHV